MKPVEAEKKPETDATIIMQDSQPSISPELERSLGQALNALLDPALSNMHSEITEREKILLQGLYVKGIAYYEKNDYNNYPRLYQTDRLQKGVALNRKRAEEIVRVLESMPLNVNAKRGIMQRVKTGVFG
jgi:hypothetical protein